MRRRTRTKPPAKLEERTPSTELSSLLSQRTGRRVVAAGTARRRAYLSRRDPLLAEGSTLRRERTSVRSVGHDVFVIPSWLDQAAFLSSWTTLPTASFASPKSIAVLGSR